MGVFRRFDMGAEEGPQRHRKADGKHQGVADHRHSRKQDRSGIAMGQRGIDLFLGEEAKEGRQAAHGDRSTDRGGKGDRHGAAQAAKQVTSRVPASWSIRPATMNSAPLNSEWATR